MEHKDMDKKHIKQFIRKALMMLVQNDKGLITRRVREECINHRLACHLEYLLRKCRDSFHGYTVDLEYNKNRSEPKKVMIDDSSNSKSIRPDIIVHERETNTHNLIAFEIKKDYTRNGDLEKIKGLMRDPYKYSYGCLISYLPERKYVLVKLIAGGEQKEEVFKVGKDSQGTAPG